MFSPFLSSLSLSRSIGQGEQDIHDNRKRHERHEHGMDGKHNRFNRWSTACTNFGASYILQATHCFRKLQAIDNVLWKLDHIFAHWATPSYHTECTSKVSCLLNEQTVAPQFHPSLLSLSDCFSSVCFPLSVSVSLSLYSHSRSTSISKSMSISISIYICIYIYLSLFFFLSLSLSLSLSLCLSLSSWWSTSCLLESAPLLHMRNTLRFFPLRN